VNPTAWKRCNGVNINSLVSYYIERSSTRLTQPNMARTSGVDIYDSDGDGDEKGGW
jgi:hypothetical protein